MEIKAVMNYRKERFPNDKQVTVIRKDLSEYKAWQSDSLMRTHGWSEQEVRIQQLSQKK
tara:strand:+ start:131 stop:307 length:177 start_codon:yes stop_codon:yes gene_type:complete